MLRLALLWISLLMVTGCGYGKFEFPKSMASMADIYTLHNEQVKLNQTKTETARERISRPVEAGNVDLGGYTRYSHNEIENLFTHIPNPTLVMYVYPHLAGQERNPVPGYSTAFKMYLSDEFAMPGEEPHHLYR